jgi:hypothetical protein
LPADVVAVTRRGFFAKFPCLQRVSVNMTYLA